MKARRVTALAALLATALFTAAAQSGLQQVTTETGALQGAMDDGVMSFKGIPFAAPPVGDLRWRPPQPAAAWTGVRQATQYGADCMQLPFPSDAAPLGTPPAEDCLYMNVWTPAHAAGEKLPVMVWIYGGGFVNGGSSPAVYDGAQFAKHGVVFVSFNYRVGRFGFFAFPALTVEEAGKPLGNYAYMDQIAALQWVQHNITAFGGNPADVTVFGESAGGGSVMMLLTSPITGGLFEKAVIESGGGRDALLGVRYLNKPSAHGLPSEEDLGVAFAKANGITGTDDAALTALRALPAEKVVNGLNMASMGAAATTYGGPIQDGTIVTQTPQQALESGHYWKVPLMIGANGADIGFPRWHTLADTWAAFGPNADKAQAVYDPDKTGNVMRVGFKIGADIMMLEPARFVARTFADAGLPSYEYRFSYVAEVRRPQNMGAVHASEIPYVFDTVKAAYGDKLAPGDEAAAQAANLYWVNFAKTGDPNGGSLPHWPTYSASDEILNFTNDGPVAQADPARERLDLIEALGAKPAAPAKAISTEAKPAVQ